MDSALPFGKRHSLRVGGFKNMGDIKRFVGNGGNKRPSEGKQEIGTKAIKGMSGVDSFVKYRHEMKLEFPALGDSQMAGQSPFKHRRYPIKGNF